MKLSTSITATITLALSAASVAWADNVEYARGGPGLRWGFNVDNQSKSDCAMQIGVFERAITGADGYGCGGSAFTINCGGFDGVVEGGVAGTFDTSLACGCKEITDDLTSAFGLATGTVCHES